MRRDGIGGLQRSLRRLPTELPRPGRGRLRRHRERRVLHDGTIATTDRSQVRRNARRRTAPSNRVRREEGDLPLPCPVGAWQDPAGTGMSFIVSESVLADTSPGRLLDAAPRLRTMKLSPTGGGRGVTRPIHPISQSALTLACLVPGIRLLASEATGEPGRVESRTWATIERVDKLSTGARGHAGNGRDRLDHGPAGLLPRHLPRRRVPHSSLEARMQIPGDRAGRSRLGRRVNVSGWVTCEVEGKFIAERFSRVARLSQRVFKLPGSTLEEATTTCSWVDTLPYRWSAQECTGRWYAW